MKSHIHNSIPKELELKIRQQLSKANVAGIGYGAQSFASVVRHKIDNFKGEDLQELINDISGFVDTTLKNSPEQLAQAFAEVQQQANKILGKDNDNG